MLWYGQRLKIGNSMNAYNTLYILNSGASPDSEYRTEDENESVYSVYLKKERRVIEPLER